MSLLDQVNIPHPNLVNIYGNVTIGKNCFIGPFVEIQDGVTIGDNCRIQSHSFICTGTYLADNVFWGHGAKSVNDKYPVVNNKDFELQEIFIEKNVAIGTNSTIIGPLTIGENTIVGAGSVVTHHVPKNTIIAGNPALILNFKPIR